MVIARDSLLFGLQAIPLGLGMLEPRFKSSRDDGRIATRKCVDFPRRLADIQFIAERVLKHGDVIRIGNSEMQFVAANAGEASTAMVSPPAPAVASSDLSSLVGKSLIHYRIDTLIARGTTGSVFKATDTRDNQVVAL